MVCSVVSNSQNAFVEGRQILEVVLLENKCQKMRFNLRGMRQGESFCLLTYLSQQWKALSPILKRAEEGGFSSGFKVGERIEESNLLLAADMFSVILVRSS
ncbi:hypothetical protein CK203_066580 [Vitis vinifera]|uniref:Uncharacterized protein n=1 Tax=Vitis vinifera TaxID=29760 RepID=A0A438EV79_VITVI|nr:hypothetical protein CK203_066580 [Vitis vinifera]